MNIALLECALTVSITNMEGKIKMEPSEVLSKIWERDGPRAFVYAIEEMSELIKALCKYTEGRGSKEEIGREVADVLVTVGVLAYISLEAVEGKKEFVLKNLEELLRKGEDRKEEEKDMMQEGEYITVEEP